MNVKQLKGKVLFCKNVYFVTLQCLFFYRVDIDITGINIRAAGSVPVEDLYTLNINPVYNKTAFLSMSTFSFFLLFSSAVLLVLVFTK